MTDIDTYIAKLRQLFKTALGVNNSDSDRLIQEFEDALVLILNLCYTKHNAYQTTIDQKDLKIERLEAFNEQLSLEIKQLRDQLIKDIPSKSIEWLEAALLSQLQHEESQETGLLRIENNLLREVNAHLSDVAIKVTDHAKNYVEFKSGEGEAIVNDALRVVEDQFGVIHKQAEIIDHSIKNIIKRRENAKKAKAAQGKSFKSRDEELKTIWSTNFPRNGNANAQAKEMLELDAVKDLKLMIKPTRMAALIRKFRVEPKN